MISGSLCHSTIYAYADTIIHATQINAKWAILSEKPALRPNCQQSLMLPEKAIIVKEKDVLRGKSYFQAA